MKSNPLALYVHIPFCKHICTYCDFNKFIYNSKYVDKYLKSLFLELEKYKNKKYKSIYIGGGTPSALDNTNLDLLLSTLKNHLDNKYIEFTIECNVEDINVEFLETITKNKINRLSIGVQTFNDKFIKYCNRHHTKDMAIENVNLASKYINNISIDLIYAFNGQNKKDVIEDLEIAMHLPIKHISYYSLLIEPNTILWNKKVNDVDANYQAYLYKNIYDYLNKNHFRRYEISNFAKYKKYESFHNKIYWKQLRYDAIGLGASGFYDNIRYTNTKNLQKYMDGNFEKSEYVTLSHDDLMFEMIMLNLRLDVGMDINKFNKIYNVNFYDKYKDAIKFLKDNKLIIIKNDIIKTTYKGSLLLNDVLEKFLD